MTDRFKSAHPPFSLTSRLVGKFSSIVRVLTRVMNGIGHQLTLRGTVTSEFVGHEAPRCLPLLLEESMKEAGRGFRIPPCLYQDIQDLTVLIHGSIQIALLAVDPDKHLIDKRLITAGTRSFA